MNVQKYLNQLIDDIETATQNGIEAYAVQQEDKIELLSWLDEAEKIPTQALDEWCNIKQTQLPPDHRLNDQQISCLLDKIKQLLDAYNCSVVFQLNVPKRLQYQVIRAHFSQQVPTIKVNYFNFSFCEENADRETCILGPKYCHCAFFDAFFEKFSNATQEETTEELDLNINTYKQYMLKKRYGDQWLKYILPDDVEPWDEEDNLEDNSN